MLPAGFAPRQRAFGRVEESSGHGFPALKRRAILCSSLRLAALAQGRLYEADQHAVPSGLRQSGKVVWFWFHRGEAAGYSLQPPSARCARSGQALRIIGVGLQESFVCRGMSRWGGSTLRAGSPLGRLALRCLVDSA